MIPCKGIIEVLQKLRVSPMSADGTKLGYTKTKKVRVKEYVKLATGAVALASVAYTVVYEHHSRNMVSVTRTETKHHNWDAHGREILLATSVMLYTVTGSSILTFPNDWSTAAGKVECLGGGGNGAPASGTVGGGGGGGGAWAKNDQAGMFFARMNAAVNVSAGGDGLATWVSNTGSKPTLVSQGCVADTGANASGSTSGLGGQVANCIGTASFRGGNGTNGGTTGMTFAFAAPGGGGGCAGPGGRGGDASSFSPGSAGGGGAGPSSPGGDASGQTGGAGGDGIGGHGANNSPSAAATMGTNWTDGVTTIGTGGGGAATQPTGALYGSGASGATNSTTWPGAQGAIVLTWTHYITSPAESMWKSQPTNLKLRGRPAHSRTYLHRKWYGTYRQIPYHTIALGDWVMKSGPGVQDIRVIDPALKVFRKSGPTLED
jgi:hypothetical protein